MVFNKEHFSGIIKREHIDPLIKTIMASNNPASWIVAAVKLALYMSYVITVYKLIEISREAEKQEYEYKQTNNNSETVDDI